MDAGYPLTPDIVDFLDQMAEDAKWAPALPKKKNKKRGELDPYVNRLPTPLAPSGKADWPAEDPDCTVLVMIEGAREVHTTSPTICGLIRLVHPDKPALACGSVNANMLEGGEYGFEPKIMKMHIEADEVEAMQVRGGEASTVALQTAPVALRVSHPPFPRLGRCGRHPMAQLHRCPGIDQAWNMQA